MSASQLGEYLKHEASAVQIPFIIVGLVVLMVAIFLWRTPLPEIKEDDSLEVEGSILKEKNLMLGVLAQFFYVGAQVCISSFFIRFFG
jgi:FHS family L-fucose permease-like MFS transporter